MKINSHFHHFFCVSDKMSCLAKKQNKKKNPIDLKKKKKNAYVILF